MVYKYICNSPIINNNNTISHSLSIFSNSILDFLHLHYQLSQHKIHIQMKNFKFKFEITHILGIIISTFLLIELEFWPNHIILHCLLVKEDSIMSNMLWLLWVSIQHWKTIGWLCMIWNMYWHRDTNMLLSH
jgi:hypothetical protein